MSRSVDPRAPVLVGAGQVVQRPGEQIGEGPIELAAEALRRAGEDSGAGDALLRRADLGGHVATVCWPYRDEATLVAEVVGASPRQTVRTSYFGGDGPQRLVGAVAQTIADGQADVALLTGAEALASVLALRKAGEEPDWPTQMDDGVAPTRTVGVDRTPGTDAEAAVGLIAPVYNYALLETAVRGRLGATPAEHQQAVGALWSRFSQVAAANPYAWRPTALSAEEIAEPHAGNRLVSAPYLKLLTADLGVDQATGLIMCSAQAAQDAGVPRDRWVFVHAAAHAADEWFLSERAELAASPAIRAAGRAALEHASLAIDEIAHVDLYSCFPSAVQIGALELGLPTDDPDRPLTVTGGLTFAGGPGNNYSSHATATLVGLLREEPEATGLATALGWYATKHALALYSASPPPQPFRNIEAEPDRVPARAVVEHPSGEATIEAYTVPFARDGTPEAAIISARTPDGARALTRTTEPATVQALLEQDPLGRRTDSF